MIPQWRRSHARPPPAVAHPYRAPMAPARARGDDEVRALERGFVIAQLFVFAVCVARVALAQGRQGDGVALAAVLALVAAFTLARQWPRPGWPSIQGRGIG